MTYSGKTMLAKHFNRIIPDSVIIHQDVCCRHFILSTHLPTPALFLHRTWLLYVLILYLTTYSNTPRPTQPMELVLIHPIHNVQDWDAAPGAI